MPETNAAAMFISVVMPVRNEDRFIAATLGELLAQDYPADRCEILVCDGMSDDRTREIVAGLAAADPRVVLVDNPGRRSSSGRNAGFRRARGDLVVVVDGHVHIGRTDFLAKLAHHAGKSGADCLGRPQPLLPTGPGGFSEALALSRASRLGHSPSSFIFSDAEGWAPAASMGAAYRRHVFDRIGYVDESFDACEDLEFNTRLDAAGLRCWTSPDLTVSYYARDSAGALFRQMHRYGFGRYKYLRRHPHTLSAAQLAPPALVLGLASLPLLALAWWPLFLLGAAVTLLYALAIVSGSVALARRTTWRHIGRYLVIFPAIHLGLGAGFLASVLRRGRMPNHGQANAGTEASP